MLNFFKNLFTKTEKTVETITATLQRTVKELELHASIHSENATNKVEEASRLAVEAAAHRGEAAKALSVASKIGGLLA